MRDKVTRKLEEVEPIRHGLILRLLIPYDDAEVTEIRLDGHFEKDHLGVTALFMMGCGGDQNPYPRSELKYAKMHGRALATAVEATLEVNQGTRLRSQKPPLEAKSRGTHRWQSA